MAFDKTDIGTHTDTQTHIVTVFTAGSEDRLFMAPVRESLTTEAATTAGTQQPPRKLLCSVQCQEMCFWLLTRHRHTHRHAQTHTDTQTNTVTVYAAGCTLYTVQPTYMETVRCNIKKYAACFWMTLSVELSTFEITFPDKFDQ